MTFKPLPLQNSRLPGTSPLGLTSLKRKNLPILVTLGGIVSCYASLAFFLIAFPPIYKLCDNKQHINVENINTDIFGLTTTLEKPTRGKLVREGVFII